MEPQGAQVVHAVGELDHQHSQVDGRRHDHLPERLRLGVIAPLGPVQLGDSVDQHRYLGPELRFHLADRQVGVLHRVMQQRRRKRGGVHPDRREQHRHRQRVGDVRRSRLAQLTLVVAVRHLVSARQQARVGLREDLAVLGDQRPHGVRLRRAGGDPGEPPRQARGRCDSDHP
jgi:hypothetical protein